MGNSPKELRAAIDAIAKQTHSLENLIREHAGELHKLLRDAPWNNVKQTPSPEAQTRQEGDNGPRQMVVIPPAPQNPNSPAEAKNKPFPWWRLVEGFGILAAVVVAGVNVGQWRDLRHNVASDERAWVKTGEFKFPIVNQEVVAYTTISSIGKSPAFDATVNSVIEILPGKQSPTFNLLSGYHRTYFGGVMFPGDKNENVPVAKKTITQPQIDSFSTGDSYYAAFGQITYRDQFGKHWTRFCAWAYNGTAPHPESKYFYAKPCTEYNAVGDGDPPK